MAIRRILSSLPRSLFHRHFSSASSFLRRCPISQPSPYGVLFTRADEYGSSSAADSCFPPKISLKSKIEVLLGPPEIHTFTANDDVPSSTTTTDELEPPVSFTSPRDDFVDSMVANFNGSSTFPPMGLTENNSATFLSSGHACLDFFFQVVPGTQPETLVSLLEGSWKKDPLTTLKLVCHLRGVRGTGKADKDGFYTAALWLHQHHPKSLALNIRWIAEFGYFKDLLVILHRILYGADTGVMVKEQRASESWYSYSMIIRRRREKTRKHTYRNEVPREKRIAAENARVKIKMEKASFLRKKKRVEMARKVLDRYQGDEDFRLLHDQIADFFADLLTADLDRLKSGMPTNNISLAAKWCPSIDRSFDKSTLLCESIARRIFPRDRYPEYQDIEEQHYAYRVRDRLRKEVLVPLRKFLELPEVYMSANMWKSLPYNRVASVAMRNYKVLFEKHDGKRFRKYLEQVYEGTAKIAAGALLPHEIVAACEYEDDKVAELQWRRMVKDLSDKGKLKNCIAVCDVSGSMTGTPMEVSVALGLLASELSEEPWKGKVITFSEEPQLHLITGETLREKASFVKQMEWGFNTDLQKVFDRILRVAVEGKLAPEQMIKRVFVFSDMEFDKASANNWETDYMVIQRKFKKKGYGSAVPEIVFWNLRDSMSTPAPSEQKGVALVSGFSKNLMSIFLERDGILSPLDVMEAAIAGDEYKKLQLSHEFNRMEEQVRPTQTTWCGAPPAGPDQVQLVSPTYPNKTIPRSAWTVIENICVVDSKTTTSGLLA